MSKLDYTTKGDITTIHVYSRKHGKHEVIIDTEDLNKITGSLRLMKTTTEKFYCRIKTDGKDYFLHRLLANCPDDKVIDHINRNPLDNRKSNLKICTQLENSQNQDIRRNNKTGTRGVSWDKTNRQWDAKIIMNGKNVWRKKFSGFFTACYEIERMRKLLGATV